MGHMRFGRFSALFVGAVSSVVTVSGCWLFPGLNGLDGGAGSAGAGGVSGGGGAAEAGRGVSDGGAAAGAGGGAAGAGGVSDGGAASVDAIIDAIIDASSAEASPEVGRNDAIELDSGGGVDAGSDAAEVGSQCPGGTTGGALPAPFYCTTRPGSTCGDCLGGETVCNSCSNDQTKASCQALLLCLGPGDFGCYFQSPANGVACYCSDLSCSRGANGPCAAQFQAVAGTTDSAEILREIQDPSTTIYRVVQEGQRYADAVGCGMFCGCF
jgi:hypothetical protein